METPKFSALLKTCTALIFVLSFYAFAIDASERGGSTLMQVFIPPSTPVAAYSIPVPSKHKVAVRGFVTNALVQRVIDDGSGDGGGGGSSVPAAVCGNAVVETGEECDDGNTNNANDGCLNTCQKCAAPGLQANTYGGVQQQCCTDLVLQGGLCNVISPSMIDFSAVEVSTSPTYTNQTVLENYVPGYIGIIGKTKYTGPETFRGLLKMDCYVNGTKVGDTNLDYRTGAGLAPNTYASLQCDDDWKEIQKGTYELKVFVDPENAFTESNENNNTGSVKLYVGVASQTEKVLVCHFTEGKGFQVITTDQNGWKNGHAKHERDYLKATDKECGLETIKPIPHLTPPPTPVRTSPTLDNRDELIRQLKDRIAKLEYKLSTLEQQVTEREQALVKKVDDKLTTRLKGRILLQTESAGEAWYVDPVTGKKFYLKDGESAYQALKAFGLGITDENLNKIPVGVDSNGTGTDTDGDMIPDAVETTLGTDPKNSDTDGDGFKDGDELKNQYDPSGPKKLIVDTSLINRLKGKILIQVQGNGEAWYVNPIDGTRHYLANGDMAYQIMRQLSLGIKDQEIQKIDVGNLSAE